jgi:hypothetical protein
MRYNFMTLAETLELTILDHRLMDLSTDWADEILFPYYEGLSIRNLAHTVMRLLDKKPPQGRIGTAPLDLRLWQPWYEQAKRVVLFVSDGVGWRLLQEAIERDPELAQIVADLTGDGHLVPITSVTPSTTAAALPSIWTGASPSATGMVGTTLFLREFGVLADMLYYRPVMGRHRNEVLEDWGLDFDTFVPVETLGEVLSTRRITSYLLLQNSLFGSGLSRLMHRGIQKAVRHASYTDLWIGLRDLLRSTRNEKCFISVYWSAMDAISHMHGTVSEQSITEIRRELGDLRDILLTDGAGDGRTVFMFTADHGHMPVPKYLDLSQQAALVETLRCGMGGEGRLGYLYLRHDFRSQAMEVLNATFPDQLVPFMPEEALRCGLFGPEAPQRETAARIGDLGILVRENIAVGDRPLPGYRSISRHGGMSDREMLVPLLIRSL